ncbi:hypothetical protein [Fusobacterium hwasookii]|uniref:hypothetical protein n=1 Tax=Fusobacterium hwasookii TaxID=1583098 RepID=UPI0004953244|nr:hypothetical protein [Fusobacterium hwasookii]ALQ38055.1 hypothetical protein RN97_07510 [Fusobacterium hwasookii ChDC F300]
MKKFLLCLFVLLSFSIFAEKITTDGKLHFDKMIGREIHYTDTADSCKIIKKGNEYKLIFYGYDPETQKSSKETSTLKIYKKIYLIDKNGIVYGYDTAKKKVAFLTEDLEVIYYED